jgi:hypothetical protein
MDNKVKVKKESSERKGKGGKNNKISGHTKGTKKKKQWEDTHIHKKSAKQRKGKQAQGLDDSEISEPETTEIHEYVHTPEKKKTKKCITDDDDDDEQDDAEEHEERQKDSDDGDLNDREASTGSESESTDEHEKVGLYEAMEILGERVSGEVPQHEFKVKWKGGGFSWETDDHLEECTHLINSWRDSQARKAKVAEEMQTKKASRPKINEAQQVEYKRLLENYKSAHHGKDPGGTVTARLWDEALLASTQSLPTRRKR